MFSIHCPNTAPRTARGSEVANLAGKINPVDDLLNAKSDMLTDARTGCGQCQTRASATTQSSSFRENAIA